MLLRYAMIYCCKESARWACFIYSTLHIVPPLCGCVTESNSVVLGGKNVFLSQTFHTNTSLYRKLLGVPRDDYCFERLEDFWLCWLRKAFPLGLNVEKTLCCQSHMPANHLTTAASYWKSMTTKKKNLWHRIYFPIRGKITFTILQKAFSLPIFPQRWQNRGWSLQEINPKSRQRVFPV